MTYLWFIGNFIQTVRRYNCHVNWQNIFVLVDTVIPILQSTPLSILSLDYKIFPPCIIAEAVTILLTIMDADMATYDSLTDNLLKLQDLKLIPGILDLAYSSKETGIQSEVFPLYD